MTFDQLCKRLLEEAPGITAPVVPKTGLFAQGGLQQGGLQHINPTQTDLDPQYTGTEAPTGGSPDPQQLNTTEEQKNIIKGLQTKMDGLAEIVKSMQVQGMPTGPKKPTSTSAPVAIQTRVK